MNVEGDITSEIRYSSLVCSFDRGFVDIEKKVIYFQEKMVSIMYIYRGKCGVAAARKKSNNNSTGRGISGEWINRVCCCYCLSSRRVHTTQHNQLLQRQTNKQALAGNRVLFLKVFKVRIIYSAFKPFVIIIGFDGLRITLKKKQGEWGAGAL